MLLLGVGIMSLSFSHSGVKPNDDNFLTPDLAVKAPTSQELLQKKFNAYNTVTEENGKSVVTIFSEEQIKDFNDRRNNGEWFWLSSEEMLFIINNTVELFKTYDIVYIRDLDGNLNKYYGLSFFSSEEYYNSFNGFDLGVMDASFDLYNDVYKTIFERVNTLTSAVYPYNGENPSYIAFTDIQNKLTSKQISDLSVAMNPWYSKSQQFNFGAWSFSNSLKSINYQTNISNTDLYFETGSAEKLYPSQFLLENVGEYKYDKNGKSVIIELYDATNENIMARIRFNSNTDNEIISQTESLLSDIEYNISNDGTTVKPEGYSVVVYLNGFTIHGDGFPPLKYYPEGNIDYFRFVDDNDVEPNILFLQGCQPLTEYINDLLTEYIVG